MQNAWRGGRTRVDEGFVVALVACDNCGHIELFSLEALGIEEIPGTLAGRPCEADRLSGAANRHWPAGAEHGGRAHCVAPALY